MNRRYVYPLIAFAVALIVWLFMNDVTDNHRIAERDRENAAPTGDLSLSAQSKETGTLKVTIRLDEGETPDDIKGRLTLISYDHLDEDYQATELEITSPSVVCENLMPGRYRLEVIIEIPEIEHDFTPKPIDIEVIKGETALHEITVLQN